MIGIIKTVTKSKSGKAFRVQFQGNDSWFGAFLDSGIDGAVGKTVDAQITPDNGYGPGIGQWAYSQATTPPAPANSLAAPIPATGNRLAEPELRFVSNVVGSAITAKTLTDPMEISVWAKAAAAAVREI